MKKFIPLIFMSATVLPMSAVDNVIDLANSPATDNVVAPENFEIKSQQIQDNFYLLNCVAPDSPSASQPVKGTPEQYADGLKRLPTAIELPYNDLVGKFIDMYLTRPGYLATLLALHNFYGPVMLEELLKQDLPTELQYLPVIESSLNPNAVSKNGASGLWQFSPSTAVGLGMEVNSLVDERRDPRSSSAHAASYLKQLYGVYGDWTLALAAYNCGMGNVNKALRRAGEGKKDFWEIYSYLPQDSRGYVPAFIATCYVMNYYPQHGVRPTVVKRRLTTDTIMVSDYVHFNQISNVLNIPIDELRLLNPQFRQDIIPGDFKPYALTLPKQQCLSYVMSKDKITKYDEQKYARRVKAEPVEITEPVTELAQEEVAQTIPAPSAKSVPAKASAPRKVKKTHVVARGESLRDIAHQYDVSATDIKLWNNLRRGKVKEGDKLIIEVTETDDQIAEVPAPKVKFSEPVQVPEKKTTKARKETIENEVTPAADTPRQSKSSRQEAKSQKTTKKAKKEAAQPKTHKVKSGESLDRIAKQYGITVKQLQEANGMKASQTTLHPGDKLSLPSKSKSSKVSKKGKSSSKKSSRRRHRR